MTKILEQVALPEHLLERVRVVRDAREVSGEFVLYWMQTAMRADENPALDVARHVAAACDCPLLIYQALSSRYDYASDRHHTFVMEGAADLQQRFHSQGISYAFALEHTGDELKQLLGRATLLIIEDMPTDPSRLFHRAALRSSSCSVLAVDTACVVPMQLVGQAYERAFEFRNATRKLYKQRLKREWPNDAPAARALDLSKLGFTSIDLEHASIAELVRQCDIDHMVTPVFDTPGGSSAGYARWDKFKLDKLKRYADDRNDALKDASSRMSAYLHYGMVSPMRIAREAANTPGAGAEKYLDELLIWRELAYSFCFYRPEHGRYAALPSWARATLDEHRKDRRTQQYTWEELSRGVTLDAFWNATQRSLLLHGELHNNVRMTWGKAIVGWCDDPRQAFKYLIDLNHRYALDGRDPSSYGGLLWCMGGFDRPFTPEQPVYGTVRTRPTWEHAKRLDVKAYTRHATRLRRARALRIAVIGVGLSGSLAARTLEDYGEQVEMFEKSERPSGRMSTRRTEHSEFDHGAQYFTCRHPVFQRYVDSWLDAGAIALWESPIAAYKDGKLESYSRERRYVAMPHMNELGKRLTRLMNVHYGVRIQSVLRDSTGWLLLDDKQQSYGPFDRVITSLPAPQAAELIGAEVGLAEQLRAQTMHPCWAVMATLAAPLPVEWGGAFINSGNISWIARNQTKPGRGGPESLVLHATPQWTSAHMEEDKSRVAEQLLAELGPALGQVRVSDVTSSHAHRWMYARPVSLEPLQYRCLFNSDRTIVACGDWAAGGRVEGAFLSGMAAVGVVQSDKNI